MGRNLNAPAHRDPMEIDPPEPFLLPAGLGEVSTTASPNFVPKYETHSSDQEGGPGDNSSAGSAHLIQKEGGVVDASTGSESEPDRDIAKKPPRISERRKAQDKVFSSWSVMPRLLKLYELS